MWIWSIIIASLAAFAVMALLMVTIEAKGWVTTRHFWDIGAVVIGGHRKKRARAITLTVHGVFAIFFGFLYVTLWSTLDMADPAIYSGLGFVTGLIHGIGAAYGLIILVSNNREGPKVLVSQVAIHAVFGLVLGSTIALMENRYEPVSTIARIMGNKFYS